MTEAEPPLPDRWPLIGITQRVSIDPVHGERRDALDQRWAGFLSACGLLPVLIPNSQPVAERLIHGVDLDGFILTGGNSLAAYGGDAPERDGTEAAILDHALARGTPLIGVCRGMQVIQHRFRVPLRQIAGHVTAGHPLKGAGGRVQVNSYHDLGSRESAPELAVTARAGDGTVEAVSHVSAPIAGLMWHPERYDPFLAEDVDFFAAFFRRSSGAAPGAQR